MHLIHSNDIQMHTLLAVDIELKMSSVFGTGQSANFTRDQFTSTISVPQNFDKYIHKLL